MSSADEIISSLRPYDFQQIRNSSDVTNSYIQHTLAEVNRVKYLIVDRVNDLTVYEGARKLLDENKAENCFVFLGDNYFVERTVTEGKEILDRQLNKKKEFLTYLESELAAMEKRVRLLQSVHVNSDGQVEIHETFEGPSKKNGRRIAHISKSKVEIKFAEDSSKVEPLISSENLSASTISDQNCDENKRTDKASTIDNNNDIPTGAIRKKNVRKPTDPADDPMVTKPKGISDKDFREFLKLVDEMMSDEEEEEKCDDDVGGTIDYDDEDEDVNSDVVKILEDEAGSAAEDLEIAGALSDECEEKENSCTMKVANVNFGKKSTARKNAAKLIASGSKATEVNKVEISSPSAASSAPSNVNLSTSLTTTSTTTTTDIGGVSTNPTATVTDMSAATSVNNGCDGSPSKKHVHFSENLVHFSTDIQAHSIAANESGDGVPQSSTQSKTDLSAPSPALEETPAMKSILRNKNEVSPINDPWMRKIEKKDAPKKIAPISNVIFSDEIVERNSGIGADNPSGSGIESAASAKQTQGSTRNTRGMSKFKKSRLAATKK